MSIPTISLGLKEWQQITRRANLCFHAGALKKALPLYRQALAQALAIYPSKVEYDHSLIAVIVSYHNIADLYVKQGNLLHAKFNLDAADQFVSNQLSNNKNQDTHISLLKAKNKTQFAVHTFNKDYPISETQKEETP